MALRNRVALVTGGSRGIGRGIAMRLAQDGARIAIGYRANKGAAQLALRQMQGLGADCVAVETDISQPGRADQLVKAVVDRFGRLDVLVNNVGDFRWGTLAESSVEDWESIFNSNVMTVFYMCRAALPQMRKGRWGRIVNLGAVGAETGVWASEDFGICLGESSGGGVVAVAGIGRSEKRYYRERGESIEHR